MRGGDSLENILGTPELVRMGGSFAIAPLHAGVSSVFAGPLRSVTYDGNIAHPNLIPPVDVVLDYIARHPQDYSLEAIKLLAYHGIALDGNNLGEEPQWQKGTVTFGAQIWSEFLASRFRRPDAPLLFELAARGFYGDVERDADKKKRFLDVLRWSQISSDAWKEYQYSLLYRLDFTALQALYQRQYLKKDEYLNYLKATGTTHGDDRDGLEYLSRLIPSPQELAIMARRFAFAEQPVIDALGLDKEYPEVFSKWAKRVGFGPVQPYEDGKQSGDPYDFAKAYWRIHWNTIAPTLAYQFFLRLRPNRDHWGEDAQFRDLVFPYSDADPGKLSLQLALRDAGYTEPFRPLLAAISYRLLGFRQLGQIQFYDLAPEKDGDKGLDWLTNRLQDHGYQEQLARLYGQTIIKQNSQRKAAQQLGVTRALIQDSWELGTIGDVGAKALLRQIGLDENEANAAVSAWEVKRLHDLGKKMVAAIRRNFLLGDYSNLEVLNVLGGAGIQPGRAQTLLNLWQFEMRQYRLERSPAILTRWYAIGTIDEAEMRRRLLQMNWAEEDVDRIMAGAYLAREQFIERQLKQQQHKGGGGKARASGQLNRAEIRALLQIGRFSVDEAKQELSLLGVDGANQDRLVYLWQHDQKLVGPS